MLNIELVGGPHDGANLLMTHAQLDCLDGLPKEIRARWRPLDEPEDDGRYVQTRKLTRQGRLIYEWSTLR